MKSIRTVCFLILFSTMVLPPISCAKGDKPAEEGKAEAVQAATPSDKGSAAAIVNGQSIPMSEVESAVKNTAVRMGILGTPEQSLMDRIGSQVLNQLIAGELLYQEAVRQGFEAKPDKVDESFSELAEQYPSKEEFNEEMERRGFDEDSLKASMKKQMSIQLLLEETIVAKTSIEEGEAREYFNQNPERFTEEEQVKASHILINAPSEADQEEKDKALARATEITDLARAEGADFAALAMEHSEGPSGPSGGDLGYFGRGRMVKPFEDAAFAMKTGEISDPVLTRFGYHVIKVTDRKDPRTLPFDEVKEDLMVEMKRDKVNSTVNERIKELSEKAEIEVFLTPESPGGPADPQPGQGSTQ
ncbi:MAG: peptidylprolyl isomerase [bacterium]|nr:MAG: peptidylprolyl isomerase [bacterium]